MSTAAPKVAGKTKVKEAKKSKDEKKKADIAGMEINKDPVPDKESKGKEGGCYLAILLLLNLDTRSSRTVQYVDSFDCRSYLYSIVRWHRCKLQSWQLI